MSRPPTLVLPVGARAGWVKTGRGRFAAHVVEPSAPVGTAVLVPGFTGSKEDFIALLAPLAEGGLRVVAVDPRGQWETPGAGDAAGYAMAELAADLAAIAEAVGGGRPVDLLGHSFGGLVAREAVLRDSAPWRSLTLMSSGPAGVDAGDAAKLTMLIDALRGGVDLETIWGFMREGEAGEESEIDAFLHRRWLGNDPLCLQVTGRQLRDAPDRVDALAAVPLPKLVLSGEADDAWPVPWQSAMAERLHAERGIVAGAGHSPNADRPAETAALLLRFWGAQHPRN
ncbi:alpha/beta hydrolase [Mangrovactinospora gilvigrisea]|uniref:Alpha/beta hydrolase n=1 Tax=Mangrovactinospora gilvigrisea TaxID=1428644 RepID=A0A1J7C5V5_9ACTN|nr:alpha/beta hydrolase [Mangrovactinospora gilvigrisea]OIV36916.1 alpha/beta hydrolase [Mangrovactinospora gilvigrisea]